MDNGDNTKLKIFSSILQGESKQLIFMTDKDFNITHTLHSTDFAKLRIFSSILKT